MLIARKGMNRITFKSRLIMVLFPLSLTDNTPQYMRLSLYTWWIISSNKTHHSQMGNTHSTALVSQLTKVSLCLLHCFDSFCQFLDFLLVFISHI